MPLSTASFILCVFLLLVGLVTVQLEVQHVRSGVRIRELLAEEESAIEAVRRLQLEHHAVVSPDRLEEHLPPEFVAPNGFPDDGRRWYPQPADELPRDRANEANEPESVVGRARLERGVP